MATQASERLAVANRARFQIQIQVFVRVRVQEPGDMARGLQLSAFGMTESATVRWIDGVVAHYAVGHLRHVGRADVVGIF
jgi:hypothetical protein